MTGVDGKVTDASSSHAGLSGFAIEAELVSASLGTLASVLSASFVGSEPEAMLAMSPKEKITVQ